MAGAPGLMRLGAPVARRCLLKEENVFRGHAAATATLSSLQSPKTRQPPSEKQSQPMTAVRHWVSTARQGQPHSDHIHTCGALRGRVGRAGRGWLRAGSPRLGWRRYGDGRDPRGGNVPSLLDMSIVSSAQYPRPCRSSPAGRWRSCQLINIRRCCPFLSYIKK
jgi:hypothetical protein